MLAQGVKGKYRVEVGQTLISRARALPSLSDPKHLIKNKLKNVLTI
jgi:hypothetical protein